MELLDLVINTLQDKQAEDITVIDMRNVNPFSDYFVVCNAKNVRHAMTLADYVEQNSAKEGYPIRMIEGDKDSDWILADLNSVVVHIFLNDARNKYRLEALWADQPQEVITTGNE